ncbi:MAG: 50S ribosomal protein L9 [Actinomycetota bacterium]|nr:50S ribosomal protein L9 [Actinomycetota bacterium]
MQVVLTQAVPQLGQQGEVVEVADGYARNYLLPKRLAIKASEGAVRQAERVRRSREEAEQRARDQAEGIATALAGTRVVIAARAGDEGKLFGSVGVADVAEAIRKFTGIEVDRRMIVLEAPIKEIGLHDVLLRPHRQVEFPLTLDVIPA